MRSVIRKKIRIQKTHDKKKEEDKPKISGEKNVSTKVFRVYKGLRYESTPLVLRQVLREYPPFGRSKYIPAQTTFRQQKDNLNYIYIITRACVCEYNDDADDIAQVCCLGFSRFFFSDKFCFFHNLLLLLLKFLVLLQNKEKKRK